MKGFEKQQQLDNKAKIAKRFVPALLELSPEKRAMVLGYALGLADKKEMAEEEFPKVS